MPTSREEQSWRSDLVWYVALIVVAGVAFGVGLGVVAGLLAGAGMLAFTLLLALGRRRIDALRVIGGAGDERNRELYLRSLAITGGMLGLVVTAWFLLGVARGSADPVLLTLTILFAVSFTASAAVSSLRG